MAEEIPFKILVDTLAAEKTVGELRQEFKDLTAAVGETKVGTEEYNKTTQRLAAVREVLGGIESDINDIAGANNKVTSSILPLQREYKELQRIIQTGRDASGNILNQKELDDVKIKLGEVGGRIRDIKQQALALDPEKRFEAFARVGSTIASGFATAQAAAALFGQENEDLVKVLVKVQAATALAQGLQGLSGFSKALREAGLAIKAFALSNPFTAIAAGVVILTTAIYELVQAIQFQTSEVAKANKEFEKTKLVANERIRQIENEITSLQGLKGAEEQIARLSKEELQQKVLLAQASIAKAQANLNEALTVDTLFEKTVKLLSASNIIPAGAFAQLKAKNIGEASGLLKQQQDTLDQLQAQINKANNDIVNSIDDRNKKIKELNDKATQQNIDNQIIELQGVDGAEEKILELKKQKISLQIFQNNEAIKGYEAEKNAALTSFALTREERNAKIQAANDEIAAIKITQSQLLAELNATANEKSKILTKELADRQAQQKALKDFAVQSELQSIQDEETLQIIHAENTIADKNALEAEKTRIQNEADKKRLELLTAAGEDTTAVQKSTADRIIQQLDSDLALLDEKAALIEEKKQAALESPESPVQIENDEYQLRLANLQSFYEQGKLTNDQYQLALQKSKTDHEKKLTKAELDEIKNRIAAENSFRQLRITAVKTGFDIIGQLAGAFAGKSEAAQRRAFNIQKAASIASTIVDTYSAAQGAYKSQLTIPTPDAPIRATIAAAIAIASGLARVAVISQTQFNATGGDTGGGTPSGGGSDFGGGSIPTPTPPPATPPQLSGTTINTDENGNFTGFGDREDKPTNIHVHVKADVVETEMTKAQRIVHGIEDRARF